MKNYMTDNNSSLLDESVLKEPKSILNGEFADMIQKFQEKFIGLLP